MLLRANDTTTLFRCLFLVGVVLLLPACDETPSQVEDSAPAGAQQVGFEATITGPYEVGVSGPGVLAFLPGAGFEKQGYFFLADGQGVRPYGVNLVLPPTIAAGTYDLVTPSPFELGTVPSVRVDRDLGDAVLSSEKNTSGVLELTVFPDVASRLSEADLEGVFSYKFETQASEGPHNVVGRFEFETEDIQGQRMKVEGTFSFSVK